MARVCDHSAPMVRWTVEKGMSSAHKPDRLAMKQPTPTPPVSNEMDSNDQHLRLSLYIQMHNMALTHLYLHEHENVHACTHVIHMNINIHHSHTVKMRQKTVWHVFSLFLDLFCVCTHPYVCTCVEVKGQLTQELVLSFHLYMGSRDPTQIIIRLDSKYPWPTEPSC